MFSVKQYEMKQTSFFLQGPHEHLLVSLFSHVLNTMRCYAEGKGKKGTVTLVRRTAWGGDGWKQPN